MLGKSWVVVRTLNHQHIFACPCTKGRFISLARSKRSQADEYRLTLVRLLLKDQEGILIDCHSAVLEPLGRCNLILAHNLLIEVVIEASCADFM